MHIYGIPPPSSGAASMQGCRGDMVTTYIATFERVWAAA
jgi:hypothetical protein